MRTLSGLLAVLLAASAGAAERPYPITETREPCAAYDPPKRPLFGDTHVHTAYSFDASIPNTRNTPRDAYRFAKGERMGIQTYGDAGKAMRTVQLDRALDWTAVTDHSETMGEVRICTTEGLEGKGTTAVWRDPAFDAAAPAYYYARVLENPTCCWSQFVCNDAKVDCSKPGGVPDALAACCDASVPRTIQERAWSSPIWYGPSEG